MSSPTACKVQKNIFKFSQILCAHVKHPIQRGIYIKPSDDHGTTGIIIGYYFVRLSLIITISFLSISFFLIQYSFAIFSIRLFSSRLFFFYIFSFVPLFFSPFSVFWCLTLLCFMSCIYVDIRTHFVCSSYIVLFIVCCCVAACANHVEMCSTFVNYYEFQPFFNNCYFGCMSLVCKCGSALSQ